MAQPSAQLPPPQKKRLFDNSSQKITQKQILSFFYPCLILHDLFNFRQFFWFSVEDLNLSIRNEKKLSICDHYQTEFAIYLPVQSRQSPEQCVKSDNKDTTTLLTSFRCLYC